MWALFSPTARPSEALKPSPPSVSSTPSTSSPSAARHAGDALPHQLPQVQGPRQILSPRHRRPLLRRQLRPLHRPHLARGGRGRRHRPGRRGRHHRDRHPHRILRVNLSDAELAKRRAAMESKGASAWKPATRTRKVSQALQAYAALTTSASRGAVRDVSRIQK
jgi:hypothetical protein